MRKRINIPPRTRFAVLQRDGFRCIYCGATAAEDKLVIDHIVPFSKGGAEEVGNYAVACQRCNQGKAARDVIPPEVERTRVRLYLAGKITGTNWRDEIIPGWSEENHTRYDEAVAESSGEEWLVVDDLECVTPEICVDYTGPWWCDRGQYLGHGDAGNCDGYHAYGVGCSADLKSNHGMFNVLVEDKQRIAANVRRAIEECDLVFAWVNSGDCYGTLFEIGLAVALGKRVVFASPAIPTPYEAGEFAEDFWWVRDEMWLSRHFCERVYAESAGAAWRKYWAFKASEVI